MDDLPPQAPAALSTTDKGVWSTAVNLYKNAIDLRTGKAYNDRPLADVAEGSVRLAASACHSLAIDYTSASERQIETLEVRAATHLASAIDHIEHTDVIMTEPLVGPDGEIIDAQILQALHRKDERLARERSAEGDSRHTEQTWASGWRILASTLLGLLDVLLLWKPLLNLSFESSSGSVFRWAIGGGLAALQVLGIEWSARVYVAAERLSVDRRGAIGDYNRPLKTGRVVGNAPPPERDALVEADQRTAHAYRGLVLIAAFIAIIGGVRVAVLARRAALTNWEAALFGVIIGLILGVLVIQMARLYCRGNLLGDRLRAESEALAVLNEKIQHARGVIAGERESALEALAAADLVCGQADRIRDRTVADYWSAVKLAWIWFGLPYTSLNYDAFVREARPEVVDTAATRDELREKLAKVNQWLGNRPTMFTVRPPAPQLGAGVPTDSPDPNTRFMPLQRPKGDELVIVGPRTVDMPTEPQPPHMWMLIGAGLTVVATLVTALLAPGPDSADQQTASAVVSSLPSRGLAEAAPAGVLAGGWSRE
jgi:hypothetical protein